MQVCGDNGKWSFDHVCSLDQSCQSGVCIGSDGDPEVEISDNSTDNDINNDMDEELKVCTSNENCPLEYLCDKEKQTCVPGCENNDDCYSQNECVVHECKPKIGCKGTLECPLAWSCTTELTDGTPEDLGCCFNPKQTETQVDDRTCMNPWGVQKFCDACTDNDNLKKECGEGNACSGFNDKEGNPLGYFCIIRWDCTTTYQGQQMKGSLECPRGYTCTYIETTNTNLQGKFCTANCSESVFQEIL